MHVIEYITVQGGTKVMLVVKAVTYQTSMITTSLGWILRAGDVEKGGEETLVRRLFIPLWPHCISYRSSVSYDEGFSRLWVWLWSFFASGVEKTIISALTSYLWVTLYNRLQQRQQTFLYRIIYCMNWTDFGHDMVTHHWKVTDIVHQSNCKCRKGWTQRYCLISGARIQHSPR